MAEERQELWVAWNGRGEARALGYLEWQRRGKSSGLLGMAEERQELWVTWNGRGEARALGYLEWQRRGKSSGLLGMAFFFFFFFPSFNSITNKGSLLFQQLTLFLDAGHNLPFPDGLLINGRGWNGYTFTIDQGKTYRFRISNVGLATSINFRIQGHTMKLVEVEGSHTLQNAYSSLDIHLGQSLSVLITADQPPKDYYIVVSSRFTSRILTTTAILHYSNSFTRVFGPPPGGPTTQIDWSLNQARSIRWNLTASGPRPNPQGSYHYGMIQTSRTIMLANSAPFINGKQRYAVNGVSFFRPDTPLKLADYFNIGGVFNLGSIPDSPNWGNGYLATSVMAANFRAFVEIVFQNWEDTVQSWHIDGYSFFVVGMDGGQWTPASRSRYNLRDTVARCTTQVYPKSWTAIYIALDNVGMWNIRSENWARQYLGQQFYLRVYSPANSWRDEYPIPKNALLCGRASGRHTRPLLSQ
ncbi:L-ascorbate oxidase homolog [Camellia sinensis]|uniref:L-ascorbate oxidase homolog n=1 Tax=Camellia sinensis TaxID=4442 RepID=UPI00103658F9|nr:L-ascorbate oxidase homolog [Camellia sinensis]